jgi:hypothetical protein
MPLAVPLVIAIVTLLLVRWPWRALTIAAAAAWLVVSGFAATGPLPDMFDVAPGALVPFDLGAGIAMIHAQHVNAVWAQYWLSRPLSYFSGDTLPVGEYGGYVGFPQRQQRVESAVDPSWVFVQGQSEIPLFERACEQRGITFTKVIGGGLVLYSHLSGTLEPPDVLGASAGRIG